MKSIIQLLVFVPAILVPSQGELTRGQGPGLLALVATFLVVLAGYGGALAGGSHTGEGFVQEGVEASAVMCVLVDVAHHPLYIPGGWAAHSEFQTTELNCVWTWC